MGEEMQGLIHYNCNLPHQIDHANAFAACGFDTTPSPWVEFPGVHVISGNWFAYRQWKDKTPLMVDRAFWDHPNHVQLYWLMPDGSHRYATGTKQRPVPEMEPWREGESSVLILADYQRCTEAEEVLAASRFDSVTVRKHPAEDVPKDTLHEALSKVDVCIGYSGTAIFEAIRMGIPSIVIDPRNPCAPVCSSWVNGELYRGNRSEWLADMAYKQFTLNEIADGTAWRLLKDVLQSQH